jgi:hypothetical protein
MRRSTTMRKHMNHAFGIALVLGALGLSGCSFVTSASPGLQTATGEAWYVRQGLFGLKGIFYCPPAGTTCIEAEIRD